MHLKVLNQSTLAQRTGHFEAITKDGSMLGHSSLLVHAKLSHSAYSHFLSRLHPSTRRSFTQPSMNLDSVQQFVKRYDTNQIPVIGMANVLSDFAQSSDTRATVQCAFQRGTRPYQYELWRLGSNFPSMRR